MLISRKGGRIVMDLKKKIKELVVYFKSGRVDIFGPVKIKINENDMKIIEEKNGKKYTTVIQRINIDKYIEIREKTPSAN